MKGRNRMGMERLRRVTTGGAWVPEVDGLRFVAIVSVVLFHLVGEVLARAHHVLAVQPRYDLLVRLVGNGDRGVRLFFVLSGYILARPFFRQYRQGGPRVSLQKYYLRRLTRLEPPYVLSLGLYATALLLYFPVGWKQMLPHFLASLFYVHSLVYHQISTINYVAWSLEVEIQFYVLVPLLALLFAIAHAGVRRAVLLACICVAGVVQMQPGFPHGAWLTILAYIQYFLAGFLLADLLAVRGDAPRKHWLWDAVSLVLWPLVYWMPHDWHPAHALLPLMLCALYMAAFLGPWSNRLFRTQWIAIVGGMCYSIYLLHPLVIDAGFKLTSRLLIFHDFLANYALQVILLGAAVALVSTVFYVWVERPCMDPNWPQTLLRRLRRAQAVTAA